MKKTMKCQREAGLFWHDLFNSTVWPSLLSSRLCGFIALMLGLISPGQAFEIEKPTQNYAELLSKLSSDCLEFSIVATGHASFRPFYERALPNHQGLCECGLKKVKKDRRLNRFLNVDPKLHQKRMGERQMRDYVGFRMFSAYQTCMYADHKKALGKLPLEE